MRQMGKWCAVGGISFHCHYCKQQQRITYTLPQPPVAEAAVAPLAAAFFAYVNYSCTVGSCYLQQMLQRR